MHVIAYTATSTLQVTTAVGLILVVTERYSLSRPPAVQGKREA